MLAIANLPDPPGDPPETPDPVRVPSREEMARRLAYARTRAGYTGVTDLCRATGWDYGVYRSHETGRRRFRMEAAEKYAREFRVAAGWLMDLTDHGGPADLIETHLDAEVFGIAIRTADSMTSRENLEAQPSSNA